MIRLEAVDGVMIARCQSVDGFSNRVKVSRAKSVCARPGVRNNTAESRSTTLPKHSHLRVTGKDWPDGGMNGWRDEWRGRLKEERGLVNKHLRADMLPAGMGTVRGRERER